MFVICYRTQVPATNQRSTTVYCGKLKWHNANDTSQAHRFFLYVYKDVITRSNFCRIQFVSKRNTFMSIYIIHIIIIKINCTCTWIHILANDVHI